MTYDKNGNILALSRSGLDNAGKIVDNMDILSYGYNGNQLNKVTESGHTSFGFKAASSNYTYDINGNMIGDSGKGITNIAYNHLNLPTQVTVGSDNIVYIYDASGVKLKKVVTEGSSVTSTSYAGNFVYKTDSSGETLQFFNHPEGYVEPDGADFNYIYQYKDHLGNIRLSYDLDEANSVIINEDYSGVTADYTWTESSSASHDVVNGELHFSATNKWQNISKYIDVVPNKTVHIEFDFNKGDMQRPILFVREKINGVWESGADRDVFILQNGHFEVDLNLQGDHIRIYFEKGSSSDDGTLTTCHIDNLIITQQVLEIVEENNYYPFGLKHNGYNNQVSANANQVASKFKYNGKELNEELEVNWYDYGARNYDASLGRWMNIDPLAEKMRRHSPYNYAFDNPIFFIDPDGMMPGPGDHFKTEEDAAKDFAQEYNGLSITYGLEVKSSIYRTTNEEGETVFSYSIPEAAGAGLAGGEKITNGAPEDAVYTADIHTHGGDEDVYKSAVTGKDASDQNQFSSPDIRVYRNFKNENGEGNDYGKKVNGYVVTPNGGLLKYDPAKHGRDNKKEHNKPITTDGIPSDPASKSLRLNKVEPNKIPTVLPSNFDPKDHKKREGYE